jgi:2-polyprenyl-3-methyl-5-hydroxy-6-metoxy-1,4-benzoquinol methylase
MNGKVHYTSCPVCGSEAINPLLTVKDYSVSGEQFVIWQCGRCSLRFTQDAPAAEAVGPYYKSPDYISHTNTSRGLINKAYQKIRKVTLQQKAGWIIKKTGKEKGRILDVGCGTGAFLQVMKEKDWEVAGIEPDADARKLAKELYNIEAKQPDFLHESPSSFFDAITLWHVLEHVHDLHPYIERLKEILKQEGKMFIAVPNYQSLDAHIYRLQWAAYDVPRHLYHFSPSSMEALMQKHGLKIADKKPMWFDSFYISLLSSKYRKGHTQWLSSLLNGLRSNVKAAINKNHCSSLVYIVSKT